MKSVQLAAAAAGVFLFVWIFRFNDPNGGFAGLTDDHFFYLIRGWQILYGDLPARDFVDHGAPLYYYVSAAVQLIARGTLSELVFSTTMLALGAALTFMLAARASGSVLLGLAGAAFQVLLIPRFYNYPKILVYTALIPALWWLADRPARRPIFWLAVITVAGFLFRYDHGAFAAASVGAMLLLRAGLPWRERARLAAVYAGLVVALATPYVLFIQVNEGVGTHFEQAFGWAREERQRTPVVWPGLFDNPDGESAAARSGPLPSRVAAVIRDNGDAWLYYFELALPLFALAVLAVSRDAFRPPWPHAAAKIAVVAVVGIILNAGFLRSPLGARLADPSVPHAVLIAWLGTALPRMLRARTSWRPSLERRSAVIRAVLTGAAVPMVIVPVLFLTKGLHEKLENAWLLDGPARAIAQLSNVRDSLRRDWDLSTWENREDRPGLITLALYLARCTPPDARVFVQSYVPQVLALARRPFAAGYADLRPGFFETPEAERAALRRMRGQNVPVVLLATDASLANFRKSFPLLTAYFDIAYDVADSRAVDNTYSFTLLVRHDARRVGSFEPFGWPCLGGPATSR